LHIVQPLNESRQLGALVKCHSTWQKCISQRLSSALLKLLTCQGILKHKFRLRLI